ncbi:MAG: hydrolase or metal-binding protein [Methylicorpusculum sp.]|uniref:recombination directionality factor n=1 Tax=Methylicorpusculum sp. TaxID=2713644 RepID=UPI002718FFCC|nr:hydrolase or metal-binding protein [Methylicorpusculum sp.]MDO8937754.1 hydrolase or metal-binding protein [Methylicorpusculum sp.]
MLKGLVISPPVLGRISIGKIVEKDGMRLPMKEDQFTLTSQLQGRDGWIAHPLDSTLRTQQGGKIRSIPIRLLFNEPELNFRAEYSLFDRKTGRPLCVGNGETCRRKTDEGIATLPCPAPEGCGLAQAGACKPYGRLNVLIGDDDPLGSFIFRTTGFNSIRTLTARLQYFKALSGNRLSCLPLELKLRGKTTRQSHGSAIYYVDITLRGDQSIEEAIHAAKQIEEQRNASGFDQTALDQAARVGFSNGAFEDNEEDGSTVVEEFFPEEQTEVNAVQSMPRPSLATQLEAKARQLQTPELPTLTLPIPNAR